MSLSQAKNDALYIENNYIDGISNEIVVLFLGDEEKMESSTL